MPVGLTNVHTLKHHEATSITEPGWIVHTVTVVPSTISGRPRLASGPRQGWRDALPAI